MSRTVRLLVIPGTIDPNSTTGRVLSLAAELGRSLGADVTFWDHGTHPLPLVGAPNSWEDANVVKLRSAVVDSDGLLIGSPEYHGTMSGVMKNTLDWVYDKHIGGRAAGLISTLGGRSNSNTLNHLRIVLRWLHVWVIPEQVAIPHSKTCFNEQGDLDDPDQVTRLEGLMRSLIAASEWRRTLRLEASE